MTNLKDELVKLLADIPEHIEMGGRQFKAMVQGVMDKCEVKNWRTNGTETNSPAPAPTTYDEAIKMYQNNPFFHAVVDTCVAGRLQDSKNPYHDAPPRGLVEDLNQALFEYFEGNVPLFWEQLLSRYKTPATDNRTFGSLSEAEQYADNPREECVAKGGLISKNEVLTLIHEDSRWANKSLEKKIKALPETVAHFDSIADAAQFAAALDKRCLTCETGSDDSMMRQELIKLAGEITPISFGGKRILDILSHHPAPTELPLAVIAKLHGYSVYTFSTKKGYTIALHHADWNSKLPSKKIKATDYSVAEAEAIAYLNGLPDREVK